jgi:hypothetical protein
MWSRPKRHAKVIPTDFYFFSNLILFYRFSVSICSSARLEKNTMFNPIVPLTAHKNKLPLQPFISSETCKTLSLFFAGVLGENSILANCVITCDVPFTTDGH